MNKRAYDMIEIRALTSNNEICEILLSKKTAEKMCKQKLKKVKMQKSNLVEKVLLKNTLQFIRNSDFVTYPFHNDDYVDEYEPFCKKPCRDLSIQDIDKILVEVCFTT